MADNQNEKQADGNEAVQRGNDANEVNSPAGPDEVHVIKESENMEVHHYPQLHHKPKPWKEYLLEFIMIFLAVTMGFFAENIREGFVNKEKEKKYIKNLIRDLKQQKIYLDTTITVNEQRIIALDTFVKIRYLDFKKKDNAGLFFTLFGNAQMYDIRLFRVNEITLSQIKSTGALSIIKPEIADIITELDMNNQYIKWSEKFADTHREEALRMVYDLTDFPASRARYRNPDSDAPAFITDDKKLLMKFFNLSWDLMATVEGYNNDLKTYLVFLNKTINTLEADYKK